MQVSNPIYFNNGNNPTEDGLFSYSIFGRPGSEERKKKWGYINLKKKFIHPTAMDLLKSLSRNIEDCALCRKYFIINDKGELIEDKENGQTGTTFLYNNFDKIKFKIGTTKSRDKKLSLSTKLTKDEIFIDKWLVCPAVYRDYNPSSSTGSRVSVDDCNKMYSSLISLTNSIRKVDSDYSFTGLVTDSKIQILLNDLYSYFVIDKIPKKTGYIHQALLGKTVDYSTRSVISAPRFTSDRFEDQEVLYGYTGVPITQLVVLFDLFYVNWIQNFMQQHENDIVLISESTGKPKDIPILEIFTKDTIEKLLQLFVKAESYRFQTMCIESESGDIYKMIMFKEELERDFTLMDLLFLASNEIIKDKYIYLTRYPIESMGSIYPSKISILSTRKTEPKTVNSTYFKNYPVVIPDYPSTDNNLIMTVIPNNSYLDDLGGDYDGDTVSIRGVYSKEACDEAEKLIKSKISLLNQNGMLTKSVGEKEALQALYTLTM